MKKLRRNQEKGSEKENPSSNKGNNPIIRPKGPSRKICQIIQTPSSLLPNWIKTFNYKNEWSVEFNQKGTQEDLYISIYSEYTEQQRNGIKRFSTHENSHVGDVFMVKTFATIQWWTQADFYKEIVNISGNRLKELFPVKIMTQVNLPCELRCLELNYALETDENTIYAIPDRKSVV